jgi:hypothetical protein
MQDTKAWGVMTRNEVLAQGGRWVALNQQVAVACRRLRRKSHDDAERDECSRVAGNHFNHIVPGGTNGRTSI